MYTVGAFYLSISQLRTVFLGTAPSVAASSFSSGFAAELVFTALRMTELRRILSCALSTSRSDSIFVVASSVALAPSLLMVTDDVLSECSPSEEEPCSSSGARS